MRLRSRSDLVFYGSLLCEVVIWIAMALAILLMA